MSIKLTYFDFHGGRGEDCRLALHLAGIDFENERIGRDQWMALKPQTPFGGLPTYEEDGKLLTQSNAILAHIGRQSGMHPTDSFDAARHEEVMNSIEHLRHAFPFGGDDEEKKEKRRKFAEGPFTQWAASVESRATGPFFDGDTLSVVDLKLYNFLNAYLKGTMDYVGPGYLEPFPKLVALHAAVREHEGVRAYYAQFE